LIAARGLRKSFGRTTALDGASLALPSGRVSVVLGPSGHGKTVLLKCLAGLLRPDAGCVDFDGRDVTDMGERELYSFWKRVGFVFQESALIDSLTVEENLALYWRVHGSLSRSALREKVAAVLDTVGLAGLGSGFPEELSGGMKKRVAVARALIKEPAYLLCDEPTSGIDRRNAGIMKDLLRRCGREGSTTLVVVTHDVQLAREMADHVVGLRKGRVLFEGGPAQLTEDRLDRLYEGVDNER